MACLENCKIKSNTAFCSENIINTFYPIRKQYIPKRVMYIYMYLKRVYIHVVFVCRGFIKYSRETAPYRPAEKRLKDWDEIYNFGHVRKGLKVQAARCMECGVPFCQSSHGCPLGNIIPKWNDLIFHNNWSEALNQLLQTNNFPGK